MDLSGLTRFQKRVEKINNNLQRLDLSALRMMMLTVQRYVRETYPNATVSLLSGNRTANTASAILDIHDYNLWFKEFGTGFEGMGTFPNWEYYPTETLTFYSRGAMQTTQGWVYAYHPDTRKQFGWYYNGHFTTGQPAQAGVTNAIVTIKYRGIPHIDIWMKDYLSR